MTTDPLLKLGVGYATEDIQTPNPDSIGVGRGPKPNIIGKMLPVLQEREGKAQHGWAGGGDRELIRGKLVAAGSL